jgi:hypothetical protein
MKALVDRIFDSLNERGFVPERQGDSQIVFERNGFEYKLECHDWDLISLQREDSYPVNAQDEVKFLRAVVNVFKAAEGRRRTLAFIDDANAVFFSTSFLTRNQVLGPQFIEILDDLDLCAATYLGASEEPPQPGNGDKRALLRLGDEGPISDQ